MTEKKAALVLHKQTSAAVVFKEEMSLNTYVDFMQIDSLWLNLCDWRP